MSFNLSTKDLIGTAVLSVVYILVLYLSGMVGFLAPVAMFFGWVVGILLGGIVFILMLARSPKFGTVTICSVLVGLAFAPGHTLLVIPACLILGVIADFIQSGSKGTRLQPKRGILAYAIFTLFMIVPLVPILLNSEKYYATISEVMGADYSAKMEAVFRPEIVVIWFFCLFFLGLAGGLLGVKVGRKHFQRAGITQ